MNNSGEAGAEAFSRSISSQAAQEPEPQQHPACGGVSGTAQHLANEGRCVCLSERESERERERGREREREIERVRKKVKETEKEREVRMNMLEGFCLTISVFT